MDFCIYFNIFVFLEYSIYHTPEPTHRDPEKWADRFQGQIQDFGKGGGGGGGSGNC